MEAQISFNVRDIPVASLQARQKDYIMVALMNRVVEGTKHAYTI